MFKYQMSNNKYVDVMIRYRDWQMQIKKSSEQMNR